MKKILFFEVDENFGGIESFLLNVVINTDFSKYQFDFITSVKNPAYRDLFEKYGVNFIYTPCKRKIFIYIKSLKQILRKNEYNIVHIQKNSLCNIIPLYLCNKYKIPYILHAQNSAPSKNTKMKKIIHYINRKFLKNKKYVKLACGENAAKWMFENIKDVIYIKNGINPDEFALDNKLRDETRQKFNMQNYFVICNVGRFTLQKNHKFIIEIFNEIKKIDKNYKLLLVGDGEEQKNIKEQVKLYKLEDSVVFLGSLKREQERLILMASDMFLMPSLYEGVSIASVEAQMAGLKLLVSDTIDKATNITGNVTFMSLNESPKRWAEFIINGISKNKNYDYNLIRNDISKAGYDMKDTTNFLLDLYSQY